MHTVVITYTRPAATTLFYGSTPAGIADVKKFVELLKAAPGYFSSATNISADKLKAVSVYVWESKAHYDAFVTQNQAAIAAQSARRHVYHASVGITRTAE